VAAADCDVPGARDDMTSPVDGVTVTVVVVTAVVEAEAQQAGIILLPRKCPKNDLKHVYVF